MSFTKFETVYKTRNEHKCYSCGVIIPRGSTCTSGFTTDTDVMRYSGKPEHGYFCAVCRDTSLNIKQ